MLAALLPLPAGVCYMKMTGDTADGWRGGAKNRRVGEARDGERERERAEMEGEEEGAKGERW